MWGATLRAVEPRAFKVANSWLLRRSGAPALFSGDTLFNAGVGNCSGGGDPQVLYSTCSGQLAKLPAATRVYPGHDYLLRNLAFTLHIEPGNKVASDWQRRCAGRDCRFAHGRLDRHPQRRRQSFRRKRRAGCLIHARRAECQFPDRTRLRRQSS